MVKGRKTPEGVLITTYKEQVRSSKKRGFNPPDYTMEEFINKFITDSVFKFYYKRWVESNFFHDFRPSCDRLEDYEPYSFENIQWVNYRFNVVRSYLNIVTGLNNKISRPAICILPNGIKLSFYSIREAERVTGVRNNSITRYCKKTRHPKNNWQWWYKDEYEKTHPIL